MAERSRSRTVARTLVLAVGERTDVEDSTALFAEAFVMANDLTKKLFTGPARYALMAEIEGARNVLSVKRTELAARAEVDLSRYRRDCDPRNSEISLPFEIVLRITGALSETESTSQAMQTATKQLGLISCGLIAVIHDRIKVYGTA